MIKGIGTDILDIARMEDVIRKYGDHFLRKVFTDAEIDYCMKRPVPAIHFAGRWASKEAFFKAMPASCQKLTGWKSIQILPSGSSGRPNIEVNCSDLRKQIAFENISSLHLSISHEKLVCIAFVVAE